MLCDAHCIVFVSQLSVAVSWKYHLTPPYMSSGFLVVACHQDKKNVMSTCKNHGSCLCSTPSVSIIFCLLVIARGTHHQPYSQMLQSAALSQPSHQHQQAAEWIMKLHQLWPLSWLVIFEDIHLSYFIQAAGPKLQVYLCPLQALLPFLLFILMCEVRYHNTC